MNGNMILVIDDSNTNLVLLESLLEKNGYRVSSALSAREGFDSIKKEKPDLIYLDFLMPEIDGIEFMKILKDRDEWKDIPVVILSAVSDADIIRQSRELGVVEYITKPINVHRIIDLTRQILSN